MAERIAYSEPNWDSPAIRALIRGALQEDLNSGLLELSGDHTAAAIAAPDDVASAVILARQELILAGVPLAQRVFLALDPQLRFEPQFAEGAAVPANAEVVRLAGRARAILSAERTALNFLAHLSGVATSTRRFVEAVAGTAVRIRDTRKTLPLFRQLEKYAVRLGGGVNHRFGLYDALLIKENHIALAGSVTEALRRAHEHVLALAGGARETVPYESFSPPPSPPLPVQIEVRNEAELREALAAGADSLLLDNLSPSEAARLVCLARELHPGCTIELSGGVNLSNLRAFAEAAPDFIAIGAITHSAPAADFSLLVHPPSR
jgi:nicotinate-nucleotide pyrophosphorylase (carboxylating)